MVIVARRANLQGKKRKDGRWEVRVNTMTTTGAIKRKSFFGASQSEAQRKAHEFIFSEGRTIRKSLTVAELADMWLKSLTVKPKTATSYKYATTIFIPNLGKVMCHELTLPKIMACVSRIDTDRKARLARVVLGTMLTWGAMHGFIQSNPLAGIRTPRSYKPVRRRVKELPAYADVFFRFLADTGLRPWKEALTLTRADLGYSSDEYFVRVADSKTQAGIRVVPITDQALANELWSMEGRLFPHSETTYKRMWQRLDVDAPIYALRSFAISNWARLGVPLEIAQRRAGHSDMRLTAEIYSEYEQSHVLTGQGVKKGSTIKEILS